MFTGAARRRNAYRKWQAYPIFYDKNVKRFKEKNAM